MDSVEQNVPINTGRPVGQSAPSATQQVKPRPISGPVPVPDELILTFDPDQEGSPEPTNPARKAVLASVIVGGTLLVGGGLGIYIYNNNKNQINASNQETYYTTTQTPIKAPPVNYNSGY